MNKLTLTFIAYSPLLDLIFSLSFAALCILIIFTQRWWKKKKSSTLIDDGTEMADNKIIAVPYRGEWITLTVMEKLAKWDHMTRAQKAQILQNQKRRLAKGEVNKLFQPGKPGYLLVDATKGQRFVKIHEKKEAL